MHQCDPNGYPINKINKNTVISIKIEKKNNKEIISLGWESKVQVGDDNASEGAVEIAGVGDAREIGVALFLETSPMPLPCSSSTVLLGAPTFNSKSISTINTKNKIPRRRVRTPGLGMVRRRR